MKAFPNMGRAVVVAAALALPSAALAAPASGGGKSAQSGTADHAHKSDQGAKSHAKKKDKEANSKKTNSSTHVRESPN